MPLTRAAAGRHRRIGDRRVRRGQQPGRADRAGGGRPSERRLQSQGRAELVLGRGRVLLRAAGVQIDRSGLTVIAVSVWLTVTLTLLVAVNPAGVGDRDLEGVVARLAEGGRGVLRRVAAVGAET